MKPELVKAEIAGVRIPDSRIAQDALALAREASPEFLLNHTLRTFVFGSLLAERRGWKVDAELLFLGALLHDLGLTEAHRAPSRFEVAGADAALRFLRERGYPEARAEVVWDAIALHTSLGIADRKRPEIALVHLGAGVDVIGLKLDEIAPAALEETLAALPRLGFKDCLVAALAASVRAAPGSAVHTFLLDLARHEVPGFACPTFAELIRAAPFAE